jgi:hypothetical protein
VDEGVSKFRIGILNWIINLPTFLHKPCDCFCKLVVSSLVNTVYDRNQNFVVLASILATALTKWRALSVNDETFW